MNSNICRFEDLPDEAILRLPEVIALVGLSRSSIYDLIARNRFPAQQKLTAYAAGWRVGAVRRWLADPSGWSTLNDTHNQPGRA